jgi:hypothetical protein
MKDENAEDDHHVPGDDQKGKPEGKEAGDRQGDKRGGHEKLVRCRIQIGSQDRLLAEESGEGPVDQVRQRGRKAHGKSVSIAAVQQEIDEGKKENDPGDAEKIWKVHYKDGRF